MNNTQDIMKACARAAEAASAFNTVSSPSSGFFTAKASGASVKNSYRRADYETYRDNEKTPRSVRELMAFGDDAYHRVGIVHNIINLMCDFVTKGMTWQHSNRAVESFYRTWWREVNGFQTSERFCNHILRLGNTVIYPSYAKVTPEKAKEWKKTRGSEFSSIDVKKGEIPATYNFLNPLTINQISGEFGAFAKSRIFTMTLPAGVVSAVKGQVSSGTARMLQSAYSDMVSHIPKDLKKKILENNGGLYFTEDELLIHHYRKDDWELWARPMISCIFPQLITLEKMHLADLSALDGAISNIRLWKIGYIDPSNVSNSLIPNPAMLQKARDLIHNNVSGGVLDLIWGPDIDFKESSTQVHQFLGPDKYSQVMREIYDGMGVPPSLSGGSEGGGGGFTNNFISMKVLIERLNYLRVKLVDFWIEEAKKVQKAMGFTSPAKLHFKDAILSNEEQHKKLLIELWDREVIDNETLRDEFNMYDKVVRSRINKEATRRENFKDPQKAGPYHDPMLYKQLQVDMIKEGRVDDEDVPFDIEEKKEESLVGGANPAFKPKNAGGRPLGSNDKTKRKQKIVNPRSSASTFVTVQNWARGAYDEISEVVTPHYLQQKGKSSVRDLTRGECDQLEDFKLTILSNHTPLVPITEESIYEACAAENNEVAMSIAMRDALIQQMSIDYGKTPSIEDKRIAACAAYSMMYCTE